MNCSREWIESLLDGELDAGANAAAGEHVATCPDCSAVYAQLQQQRAKIRVEAPYYSAPPGLEASVRGALRRAAAAERPRIFPWRGLAIAASLLLAVSAVWNVVQFRKRATESDLLASSVLSSHIRSLIGTHLLDVPSSDQHTVKPWFNGKLDFSPAVKDLAAEGFPLAGGRIDYLNGRTVAALVYHRRLHVINLYIWPSPEESGSRRWSRNGFNLLQWAEGSMTYWAVSDIPMAELERFRDLLGR